MAIYCCELHDDENDSMCMEFMTIVPYCIKCTISLKV